MTGVRMTPKKYIAQDFRYTSFEEVRDPLVRNETGNEEKVHTYDAVGDEAVGSHRWG